VPPSLLPATCNPVRCTRHQPAKIRASVLCVPKGSLGSARGPDGRPKVVLAWAAASRDLRCGLRACCGVGARALAPALPPGALTTSRVKMFPSCSSAGTSQHCEGERERERRGSTERQRRRGRRPHPQNKNKKSAAGAGRRSSSPAAWPVGATGGPLPSRTPWPRAVAPCSFKCRDGRAAWPSTRWLCSADRPERLHHQIWGSRTRLMPCCLPGKTSLSGEGTCRSLQGGGVPSERPVSRADVSTHRWTHRTAESPRDGHEGGGKRGEKQDQIACDPPVSSEEAYWKPPVKGPSPSEMRSAAAGIQTCPLCQAMSPAWTQQQFCSVAMRKTCNSTAASSAGSTCRRRWDPGNTLTLEK